jgi:hypothetical protein
LKLGIAHFVILRLLCANHLATTGAVFAPLAEENIVTNLVLIKAILVGAFASSISILEILEQAHGVCAS